MKASTEIDYADMQALIRFAHGHLDQACFLLLEVRDAKAACTWLRNAPVTNAESKKSLPDCALQIAFTAAGLCALELSESLVKNFSEEFTSGMTEDQNRSRRLGDVGNNRPQNWRWGGSANNNEEGERKNNNPPHVLLMIYAHKDGLYEWREKVNGSHFDLAFNVQATLTTATLGRKEPFGFDDGISQPKIDWDQNLSTDLHERDQYVNLLALGEILLGYPNEYGLYTHRPLLDPQQDAQANILPKAEDQPHMKDLGRNGTYLVFRQLEQDVSGFWQYLNGVAKNDRHKREQLAAAMVGRQRDGGSLIKTSSEQSIESIAKKSTTVNASQKNNFTYDDDPDGRVCPIGAHIRRSNPRSGDFPVGVTGFFSRLIRILGFGRRHIYDDVMASTRFHRILRRGRPYGPVLSQQEAVKITNDDQKRGLHFVALGANISRQFEFVQAAWNMSSKFGGLSTEADPLLGNREPLLNDNPTNRFTVPQENGPAVCLKNLPQFITVVGGAYFFMPGIKAIQYIAGNNNDNK